MKKERLQSTLQLYLILGMLFLITACSAEAQTPNITLCVDRNGDYRCNSSADLPLSNIPMTIYSQDSTPSTTHTNQNGQIPLHPEWSLDLDHNSLKLLCLSSVGTLPTGDIDITFRLCDQVDA